MVFREEFGTQKLWEPIVFLWGFPNKKLKYRGINQKIKYSSKIGLIDRTFCTDHFDIIVPYLKKFPVELFALKVFIGITAFAKTSVYIT